MGLYRKLVVGSAWRKQMPKLAVSLGLGGNMPGKRPTKCDKAIAFPKYKGKVWYSYYIGSKKGDKQKTEKYEMKPKDVRGPLPTTAALQAMLREKEKENIALHKRMDDMENAHNNDMDELEDQVRMLANLVMANQQTSAKSSANTGSDEDDCPLPSHSCVLYMDGILGVNNYQEKRNSS
ncbi:hypothetical protein Cgig2_033787 [Carnegiea gigantea]|uniref:Uncharacterized protein n=1 Tax=Carnegiea gigantea TaxID=171969 RepID=A0A9Q1GSL3_9CARY|nr:hypothetical protein Cgig2_033787 [Carnegiea gigantea]